MEWMYRLNESINYIEQHITDDIQYEDLARVACCSSYHFQRMFTYLSGTTLSEYVKRRRMSLAAVDILQDDMKIIDIALKYGYSSPTAFNRAFQAVHGIAPSAVKKEGANIKSFPKITFKLIVKGGFELNYKIVNKEAFRVVGVSQPLFTELEKNFEIVPTMWQQVSQDGTLLKLLPLMNKDIPGVFGISFCNDEEKWEYCIAVASNEQNIGDLKEYTVPAFTYAVFPGEGVCPQAIQELEQRIITEWLPSSGYEYANGPDIELYLEPNPQNAKFEVWIPVVKSQAK